MTDTARDRYLEDLAMSFAMYCDDHGMTLSEGQDLATECGDRLADVADERRSYLPKEMCA